MKLPQRGEVWMLDLNPMRGHEQAGRRPCLVVSDDLYNAGLAEKHIVVPVTSQHKGIPYHVEILPPEGGLRMRSYVMCDDVRTVSRGRFEKRSGTVSPSTMLHVSECLRILMSI